MYHFLIYVFDTSIVQALRVQTWLSLKLLKVQIYTVFIKLCLHMYAVKRILW